MRLRRSRFLTVMPGRLPGDPARLPSALVALPLQLDFHNRVSVLVGHLLFADHAELAEGDAVRQNCVEFAVCAFTRSVAENVECGPAVGEQLLVGQVGRKGDVAYPGTTRRPPPNALAQSKDDE